MAFRGSNIPSVLLPPATGSQRGVVRLSGDLDQNSTPDAPMIAPALRSLILGALQGSNPDLNSGVLRDYVDQVVDVTAATHTLTQAESGGVVICSHPDGTQLTLPNDIDLGSHFVVGQAGGPITLITATGATLLEPHGYTGHNAPNTMFTLRVWDNDSGTSATWWADGLTGLPTTTDPDTGEPEPEPNAAGILDNTAVPKITGGAYSTRRLSATYTGPAMRIVRSDTGAERDIAFLADGSLDVAAIASHCAVPDGTDADGLVGIVYEQSGLGRHMTFPVDHRPTLYWGGSWGDEIAHSITMKHGQPFLVFDTGSYGTSSAFPAYTGSAVTAVIVASMSDGDAAWSPRLLSVYGSSNTDSGDTQGAALLVRDGAGEGHWGMALLRSNATRVEEGTGYAAGDLEHWVVTINDPSYAVSHQGQSPDTASAAIGNFNATRIASGWTGNAAASAAGQGWSEILLWLGTVPQPSLDIVRDDQQATYDLPEIAPVVTVPSDTSRFTEEFYTDFASGIDSSKFMVYNNSKATSYKTNSWMASQVIGANGLMRLKATNNGTQRVGAAVYLKGDSNNAMNDDGGLYEVKLRCDGNSRGLGFVFMGWASVDPAEWPTKGEPDIIEVFPGNTSKYGGESNLHYGPTIGTDHKLRMPVNNASTVSLAAMAAAKTYLTDWTQWHVAGVIWKPGQYIEVLIDGITVAKTTDLSVVPNGAHPLRWGIQQEFYGIAEADAFTGDRYLDIAWWRYSSFT